MIRSYHFLIISILICVTTMGCEYHQDLSSPTVVTSTSQSRVTQESLPARGVIISLTLSSDGEFLAVGTDVGLYCFNPDDGGLLWSLEYPQSVSSLAYSRDNKVLAVGLSDGTLHLIDAKSGSESIVWKTGSASVDTIDWSSKSDFVASGSLDAMGTIWDPSNPQPARTISPSNSHPNGGTTAIAWSPDSSTVAIGALSGVVTLWDVNSGNFLSSMDIYTAETSGVESGVRQLSWDPSGQNLLVNSKSLRTSIWNTTSGQQESTVNEEIAIRQINWEIQNEPIGVQTEAEVIKILNLQTEDTILIVRDASNDSILRNIAISISRGLLVADSADRKVRVWDINDNKLLTIIDGFGQ